MNEKNIDVLEVVKAREIVQAVLDYGVNQDQILKIIKMLSLELEDLQMARNISLIIDGNENDQPKPRIEI